MESTNNQNQRRQTSVAQPAAFTTTVVSSNSTSYQNQSTQSQTLVQTQIAYQPPTQYQTSSYYPQSSTMSSGVLNKRKEKDVMKLLMSEYEVIAVNEETTNNEFIVKLKGPAESIYEGGQWYVRVMLPDQYPHKSPSIGFINKIYHPNIDEQSGSVCLDVINQTWSPMYDLVNIFDIFIPQLLLYPNPKDPLNPEAAKILNHDENQYNKKVREHVAVNASDDFLKKLTFVPQSLRINIEKSRLQENVKEEEEAKQEDKLNSKKKVQFSNEPEDDGSLSETSFLDLEEDDEEENLQDSQEFSDNQKSDSENGELLKKRERQGTSYDAQEKLSQGLQKRQKVEEMIKPQNYASKIEQTLQ
eukprot:403331623